MWTVYRDRRFWRIAPLSTAGIGTSRSLQGLWAGPWLRDVDGLDRATIVQHLSVMAIAVCAGALLLGAAAAHLRRFGIRTESVLASTIAVSTLAQTTLILDWALPSIVAWAVIAAVGGATVLSFAILAEHFPKEMSGRANAALNMLHVGGAFVLQSGTGIIIAQWPQTDGAYAVEGHQAAMAAGVVAQLAALAWFAMPRQPKASTMASACRRAGAR